MHAAEEREDRRAIGHERVSGELARLAREERNRAGETEERRRA